MKMERSTDKDRLVLVAEQNVKEAEYWKNRLAGDLEKSVFPYDFRVHNGSQYAREMKTLEFSFTGLLYQRVMQLSKGSEVKLHILLAAVLFVLIEKYTSRNDVMIGSPIARQEIKGDFVNTVLVFRHQVEPEITFKDLLLQVRETIVEANRNQNYPLEILVQQLGLTMTEDDFPLFDVVLLLENIHDKDYIQHIPYHILFAFSFTSEKISGYISYQPGFYREETIVRLIDQYFHVAEQVFFNVDLPISGVMLMRPAQLRQVTREFNRTDTGDIPGRTLQEWFEAQVQQSPDRVAVIGPPDDSSQMATVTFAWLNEQANELAGSLINKGVGEDTLVAVMAEPSIEMIVGILGILKAGGAYLPLDPGLPGERIDYILADSGAGFLVMTPSLAVGKKRTLPGKIESVVIDIKRDNRQTMTHEITQSSSPRLNSLAYVIYTSGTTGKPKGVLVEQQNIVGYINSFSRQFSYGPENVLVQLASYTFDLFLEEVFPILLSGGRVVIPHSGVKTDIVLLHELIVRQCVDIIDCTPLLLKEINRVMKEAGNSIMNYGQHFTFISGGDELKAEYIDRLLAIGEVFNTYGPTETTVCATFHRCTPALEAMGVPIGKPIADYQVYILDGFLKPLPIGVPGELCVGGIGVTRGYLNNPGLTAERFVVVDPQWFYTNGMENKTVGLSGLVLNRDEGGVSRNCVYKTGDLARWLPDGSIEFLGRIDTQVKLRGYRIELGEIESRLLQHPLVKAAVVLAVGDNQDDKYICAYVVSIDLGMIPGSDFSSLIPLLREHLGKYLPDYMIPTAFVPLEEIPLTASGKVNRKALPAPKQISTSQYEPPRDEIDEKMVELWSQVLEIEKSKIGINHHFFELGGHSLRGTVLIAKVHQAFNVRISLADIFERPVLRALCDFIRESARDTYISIEASEDREYYPLSPAQKRLYILESVKQGSTTYNMPLFQQLNGEYQEEKIRETFQRLMARHESLRTSIHMLNGEPVQRIHPSGELTVKIEFFIAHSQDELNGMIERSIRPFDLQEAPFWRVNWIQLGSQQHLLFVDMHHIISDANSLQIMSREVVALYRDETLSELRLQYRDFAQWNNRQVDSGEFQRQEAFWLETFTGGVPVLNLLTDFPRSRVRRLRGPSLMFRIGAAESLVLRQYARQDNASRFMLVLALYIILLHKLSGQEDIVVGTVTAGRRHPDLEPIIGFFINTLVLRCQPRSDIPFSQFLLDIKEHTIKAFDNQDYPFEELVQKLLPRRTPERNPLFDVMVSFSARADETADNQPPTPPQSAQKTNTDQVILAEETEIKFDLTLTGSDAGDEMSFFIEFSSQLFKTDTIQNYIRYFKEIITQVVQDKHIKMKDIAISHSLGIANSSNIRDDTDDFGF